MIYRGAMCAAASVLAITIGAPALAQQAGLQVAVVDADTGAPVTDADLTIRDDDRSILRRARTDARGQVRLEPLPTGGGYIVAFAGSDAFAPAQSAPVALRSNHTRSITLRLAPADTAAIVVTASRTVTGINTVNAEISGSLTERELRDLPIEGRDVIGALVRLPNVVPSTGFFPESPVISINGANGLETNYLIDGLDNNENFLGGPKFPVPLGFTREVTVIANSYSVLYGRTPNGLVNYTTPSGSNEWQGEAYTLVRPGRPLDAASAFPRRDFSGNPVGESFERYQAGGAIGGPIVRDRTFFYANLEYTRDRNIQIVDAPALGVIENVTGNNQFILGSLRLDHRLSDDWTATLRANVGRVTIDRPGGGLGGGNVTFPSAGSTQDRFSTLVAGSISYAGPEWSYDGSVQFSRFRWDYGEARGGPGPQVAIRDQSGLTIGVVGHSGFVFDDLEESWQTVQRVQRRFGDHRISIGADLIHSRFALAGGGNPDGNYVVALTPAQLATLNEAGHGLDLTTGDVLGLNPQVIDYAVELRPATFGRDQNQLAFHVEDEWRLSPTLTATLGLRWDYDSLTALGGGGGDYDNVAPRLAVNFRPDARSSIRFGAGIFHGKLLYSVISDALQRSTTAPALLGQLGQLQSLGIIPAGVPLAPLTFDGNLAVSVPCVTASACPSPEAVQGLRDTATINEVRILNPDGYDNPYSLQLSAGYQYQLSDSITLGVDAIYSRSRNLVRLRDLNAPAPFTPNAAALTDANLALLRAQPDNAARFALAESLGLVRGQATADATRPVGLVPGGGRQITVSETEGRSLYRALNFRADKARGADDYAFTLVYTLGKLTNDTDDINFRASDANNFAADYSPSANDRRHVISAVGYLYPFDGFTVTAAGLFQSGQPINLVPDASIFGTQDLNGDGQSFGENFVGNSDRFPGASRNSGRLPWSTSIDLGVRYGLPIAFGRVELSADVFNVLNTNNESGFANAATTSNQVQFGGGAPFVQRNAGPPRQFQFGAAFKF
ncbi:TonB-dependent receptor [Sphingomonas suaedae]|uniref:TonB-dependent receptor n=2 Tax=Sphingomonas suaedae TaxID=2599297 RepID=A0A518RLJ8_9SPHN|nr:TonB-dependent receptor [Sphingomonas suaedae]